jgi:hypothetical protein
LEPLIPVALAPVPRDSAIAWSRSGVPATPLAYRIEWRYRDEQVGLRGRGTARFAPPDSLRFDYQGPFRRSGAAVVIGDSVVWAEPSGDFESLLPAIPILWASFGIVRPPAADSDVFLDRGKDGQRLWRFVRGPDTLEYVAYGRRLLEAEWRRGGSTVARSATAFDSVAMPANARILFPEAPARFEFTVVGIDSGAVVPPALWRSRR